MKYITIIPTGFEIRFDTSHIVPQNSIELTNEQYDGLLNGTLQYVNGKIIAI